MRNARRPWRSASAAGIRVAGRGLGIVGVALATANCGGDPDSQRRATETNAARVALEIRQAGEKVSELEAESVKLLAKMRDMEEANRSERHVLYHNLACIYRQGGRFAEAESAFLEALRLDPATPDTHLGLGLLYDEDLRRPGKARAHFLRFLELSPDSPHAADVRTRLDRIKKQTEEDGEKQ